jgi:hypothetical protein
LQVLFLLFTQPWKKQAEKKKANERMRERQLEAREKKKAERAAAATDPEAGHDTGEIETIDD